MMKRDSIWVTYLIVVERRALLVFLLTTRYLGNFGHLYFFRYVTDGVFILLYLLPFLNIILRFFFHFRLQPPFRSLLYLVLMLCLCLGQRRVHIMCICILNILNIDVEYKVGKNKSYGFLYI